MGKEDKIISQGRLKLLLAKHIKKHAKHLGDKFFELLNFDFKWGESSTTILFGGEAYSMNGFYKLDDLNVLIEDAFKETGCNGVVCRDGATIRVRLYGKPTSNYKLLDRLVYKYSGFNMKWDTIRTDYVDNPLKTKFLCYDEDTCREAIDFIRENRTSKDMLVTNIDERMSGSPDSIEDMKILILKVKTPKGKVKAEESFITQ